MKVSPQAYAIFDFEGRVKVRVTLKSDAIGDLSRLKIRPLTAGVRPRVDGRTIEFEMDRPGDLTVDPLGTGLRVLHIFANSPEKDVPKANDPGVVYFGPGVHDIEDLELKAGQTLYLAGGAVLRPRPARLRKAGKARHYTGREYALAVGAIRATGDNVTIRGRGVISGERGLPAGRRFGLFRGSRMSKLRMRGVVFTRSTGWTILMHDCSESLLDRVRVLGYFTNSDGICLHSCRDCAVRNCFIHTADDCYEVKAKANRITFEHSQVWCDAGAAMGVTHEIDGLVENVVWRNITVLHYTYRHNPHEGITSRGAIFVHPAMGGTVKDLLFENIAVERCSTKRPLIVVYNVKRPREGIHHFPDKPHSRISNVTFRGLRANNVMNPEILIQDEARKALISGIQFESTDINGKRLKREDKRLRLEGVKADMVSFADCTAKHKIEKRSPDQ
jgi:polygalacturonase